MEWHEALRIARSARSLAAGKPLRSNTRMMINGTKDAPVYVAVKYHRTEIIRYYPDGSMHVNVNWTTSSTIERLRQYGGVYLSRSVLPAINGLRPRQEAAHFLYYKNQEVPANSADGGYIRILPNGQIDMDSVKPYKFMCITHPTELRQRTRRLHRLTKLVLGYGKLMNSFEFLRTGTVPLRQWLAEREDIPTEEVTLSPFPQVTLYPNGNFRAEPEKETKQAFDTAIGYLRWEIATREGWTGTADVWHSRHWTT